MGRRAPPHWPTPSRSRRSSSPKIAGFEIPADRKFIIVHGDGIGKEHPFSGEKLTTLLAVYKYKGFDQALDMMRAIYDVGGKGHSCGIYSFDQDHIHRLGDGRAGVADHGAPAAVARPTPAPSTTACR